MMRDGCCKTGLDVLKWATVGLLKPLGVRRLFMHPVGLWMVAMVALGLATLGLMFAFLVACDKV